MTGSTERIPTERGAYMIRRSLEEVGAGVFVATIGGAVVRRAKFNACCH